MTIILPNIRTGNTNQPVYGVSATEIAIAKMANILVWLKADSGFFSADKSKWYDALNGAAYTVTGTLVNTGAINSKPAAVFTGSQSVDMGTNFPVSADYTIISVLNPTSFPAAGGIVGSKSAGWRALYFTPTTGGAFLGVAHNGGSSNGTVVHAANTPVVVAQTFEATGRMTSIYFGGALERTSGPLQQTADNTMVLGAIPGLSGDRFLRGNVAETMIFARDISKLLAGQSTSDLTTVTNWLKSKYAV